MDQPPRAELCDPGELDPAARDSWRELAVLRENPFLTPEWYEAWLGTHPGEEPFLIVWREGAEVRGVLPLVRAAARPLGLLRFAGARRGDWFTPACRVEDEEAMAAACGGLLMRERDEWRLLRMDRVDSASAWPQALWAEGTDRGIAASRPGRVDVLPYIEFEEGGYAAYMATRSRNFRSQVGRRQRKLEREHALHFRMTSDPAELTDDLGHFFRLHEERWRDRGGSSALSVDAMALHRRFAALALERGWLRLWVAEADGAPAAVWYGWRLGDRYLYSLSGLSGAYEQNGLGTVLLAHTIEAAAGEGAAVYDLMWGDEQYKRRFETGRRHVSTWMIGRRRHPLRAAAVATDRLADEASQLPPKFRNPLKRAYSGLVRG